MARFRGPRDVAINAAGQCYVSDFQNVSIRVIAADGTVSTVAGGGTTGADGTGSQVGFFGSSGLALDRDGALYIADNATIRRMLPSGTVSTLAGNTGGLAQGAFGPGVEALFPRPLGIAVNAAGQVVINNVSGILAVGTPWGAHLRRSGGTAELLFGDEPFRNYFVERSTSLKSGQWTTLSLPAADFSGGVSLKDNSPPAGAGYYRLRPR